MVMTIVTQRTQRDAVYVLGHSAQERARLMSQGVALAPLTRRLFIEAGIEPGMRVLDLGCGMGDVSVVAAELVGPRGDVVGIDRDASVVGRARERFAELGMYNVAFTAGDFRTAKNLGVFDAVVGRFVLMYQADAAAALQAVLSQVRSGGIVAFQEWDGEQGMVAGRSAPLYDQAVAWVREAFRRSGANIRMGIDLYPAYVAAGLPTPMMVCETLTGGAEMGFHEILTGWVRSVLPAMEEFGIATAAEIQIETLAARLRAEIIRTGGCIMSPPLIGAYTRKR